MCALFTGSQTFKLKYLEITKNTFMHFYQSTHDIDVIIFINSFIVIRQGAAPLHNRTLMLNHWLHTPI